MDQTDSRLAPSPEPASDDAASPISSPARDRQDLLDFEPVPLRYRTGGLTPAKQREYVEALADTGVAREAAARIGLSEQAINRVRRRLEAGDFDRACEAAHRFGARHLRSIAFERAIEGTLKGHYYHGELVSQERVHDNRLLIYLLGKTEHLLDSPEETGAICENWEPHMDALEQGLPPPAPGRAEALPTISAPEEDDDNPQVWCEDGIWWTYFPPPEDFDGEEEGEIGDRDYHRTLTDDEEAVMEARNEALDEAEMARCCDLRDRYFGLPNRGAPGFSIPREAETNETNETSDPDLGPIEYKSMVPPDPGHVPPRPGIMRVHAEARSGLASNRPRAFLPAKGGNNSRSCFAGEHWTRGLSASPRLRGESIPGARRSPEPFPGPEHSLDSAPTGETHGRPGHQSPRGPAAAHARGDAAMDLGDGARPADDAGACRESHG